MRLSPEGRINFFNNAGTVNIIADVVGYYADHNHDDRYPQKLQVTFDLAAGGISAPIAVPPNVPVSLTGWSRDGRCQGSRLKHRCSRSRLFIQWVGLESTNALPVANFALGLRAYMSCSSTTTTRSMSRATAHHDSNPQQLGDSTDRARHFDVVIRVLRPRLLDGSVRTLEASLS